MKTTKRSNEVDIIRMAALIGICIVNVPFMALPPEAAFVAPDNIPDKAAAFIVECFFQLKFFILFSFIFGWGMAIQSRSATARQQNFRRRYFGRIVGLALLGICHAIFVFSGDILVLYALLGSLLWLVKDHSPRTLMKIASWMLPLAMLCLTLLAFVIEAAMADKSMLQSSAESASLGGSFAEATQARARDWPFTFAFLLLLQGPLAFAAFVTGLAAAKSDFFAHDSAGFAQLRQRIPLLLTIALPLNILYAAVVGELLPPSYELLSLIGFVLIAVGAPALSLVYLYLFIQMSRTLKLPQLLVLAGRNSLSAYVLQGVLAGFVFGAYGLGLFDSLGHAALLPISLLIALLAMGLTGLCARTFGRGPLEPILRLFTR